MMRIIIEGCGKWALEYVKALKALGPPPGVGVIVTFDSTFGLDAYAEQLPADLYAQYLEATLRNVREVQGMDFACCDVKDTLFRLQGRPYAGRARLPRQVDAV